MSLAMKLDPAQSPKYNKMGEIRRQFQSSHFLVRPSFRRHRRSKNPDAVLEDKPWKKHRNEFIHDAPSFLLHQRRINAGSVFFRLDFQEETTRLLGLSSGAQSRKRIFERKLLLFTLPNRKHSLVLSKWLLCRCLPRS